MVKDDANFTSQELAQVLSYYDIGIIQQTKALSGGNAYTAKKVVVSNKGKYMLKRRAKGKDGSHHVAFTHEIHDRLREKNFPVAELIPTDEKRETALYLDGNAYELFGFVQGTRHNGSHAQTQDAGRQLGRFGLYLSDFAYEEKSLRATFHDAASVRGHLKSIGSDSGFSGGDISIRQSAEMLMNHYNRSSVQVNALGFDSWNPQIIHGDWHPGNMLFSSERVVAVLDFDSVKVAPVVTDLANGLLQFSIVAGRPNPTNWPAYPDQAKLADFLGGYREIVNLQEDMLLAVLDLMIETMIAEAVLPIATTGFFGNLSGQDFLQMICRKCDWIDQNRELLIELVMHK